MKFLRRMAILLAVALLLPVSARAAGGSITVEHKLEDGTPLTGVTFRLYRVEESITTAPNAYAYMLKHELEPVASLQTDEQGSVVFSDLEDGKYLLVGGACQVGDQIYLTSKSLLEIPGKNADGTLGGQITVYPKSELQENEPIQYQVLVIWDDENYEHQRPDSVTVYLYRNCQIQDPITISKDDNWRYSWIEQDPQAEWGAVQNDLDGYTIDYDEVTRTFVIRNILTDSDPTDPADPTDPSDPSDPSSPSDPSDPSETKPTEPDGPKLPQTGQLWWPVPVLAILGIVFLLIGWLRQKESQNEA